MEESWPPLTDPIHRLYGQSDYRQDLRLRLRLEVVYLLLKFVFAMVV